jgi:exopolyphosphatase / guanosine-5'-triphosphate,3'-diphosphate pyrophosphatase
MRIAVIDLGTNTFNLLIVDRNEDMTYKRVASSRIPVKLGEGAINKGYIAKIPYERGIRALKKYARIIGEKKADKVYAFATSAIRSASNGKEFILDAKSIAGIHVEVIDGNREAELIYFGNRQAVKMTDEISLIMDIGGGSTEFILANKNEIFWKQSFLLGAARLLELIHPSDPIKDEEINQLEAYLKTSLQPLFEAMRKYPVKELIGSSGAFDSIIDMLSEEFQTESLCDEKTEYCVDMAQYFPLAEKVIGLPYKERLRIRGLIEMRVDMIVISCLFVNFILKEFDLKEFRVSTYSLKEGVIYSI